MEHRAIMTILAVDNLSTSSSFYKQVFGWAMVVEVPVYVEFELPDGNRLALYQRSAMARNTEVEPRPSAPDQITATELYLRVEDLESCTARLQDAGARTLSSPRVRDWGDKVGYFADPDGNILAVTSGPENTPNTPNLHQLAERWLLPWQGKGTDLLDSLHAECFVDHSPAGRAATTAGFKQGIIDLYSSFPDFYGRADDIIVDKSTGKVTIIWTATGTHSGSFLGVPPSGRKVKFSGIEVLKFENGQITERWGEWDGLNLLEQLSGIVSAAE